MHHNRSIEPKYALYPWFAEHGSSLVHPDDWARFRNIVPYGKVFIVEQSVDGMVELYYGSERFRVKPDLLEFVPTPAFEIGQRVCCVANGEIAEVTDI